MKAALKSRFPRAADIYRAHLADVMANPPADCLHANEWTQRDNFAVEAQWRTICTLVSDWMRDDRTLEERVKWLERQFLKLAALLFLVALLGVMGMLGR